MTVMNQPQSHGIQLKQHVTEKTGNKYIIKEKTLNASILDKEEMSN